MQSPKTSLLCLILFCVAATTFAAGTFPITAFGDDAKPHVVMLIGEREYDTKTTLPQFAEKYLADKYVVSYVYASDEDPNFFDGIEKVRQADVLLVSVRRRTPPTQQLDIIREYVDSGKPLIGIRTASHAFSLRNQAVPEKHAQWLQWDHDVFGGNYHNHYGKDLKATITLVAPGTTPMILLRGLPTDPTWTAGGTLYKVSPLAAGTSVLLEGNVPGQPGEPVAWTFHRHDGGASFYTSLGHPDDFAGPLLPQLLANAIDWSRTVETKRN